MTQPSSKQISTIRWLAIGALALLFVSDFGFSSWAKPVPNEAYWVVGAAALGIDLDTARKLLVRFLEGFIKKDGDSK
jgi:hypothetical protein